MFPRIFPFLQQKLRYQGCVQKLRWQHGARQHREPSFPGEGPGAAEPAEPSPAGPGASGAAAGPGPGPAAVPGGGREGAPGAADPHGRPRSCRRAAGESCPQPLVITAPQPSLPPAPQPSPPRPLLPPRPSLPPAHGCHCPRSYHCPQPTASLGFTPHGEGHGLGAPRAGNAAVFLFFSAPVSACSTMAAGAGVARRSHFGHSGTMAWLLFGCRGRAVVPGTMAPQASRCTAGWPPWARWRGGRVGHRAAQGGQAVGLRGCRATKQHGWGAGGLSCWLYK